METWTITSKTRNPNTRTEINIINNGLNLTNLLDAFENRTNKKLKHMFHENEKINECRWHQPLLLYLARYFPIN